MGDCLRGLEPWEPTGPDGAVVPALVILEKSQRCWHISDHLLSNWTQGIIQGGRSHLTPGDSHGSGPFGTPFLCETCAGM